MKGISELPPLSLYVHIPWCLQKCPYCDFNSHAVAGGLNQSSYVAALLKDLDCALPLIAGRELISIFIGGGTPSLFSGEAIARLLDGISSRLTFTADAEVTLEANPGVADQGHFKAYRQAGVNRISIGVQSFTQELLRSLGRIHGPSEALAAVAAARLAGINNLNLDIMYGLPGQTQEQAEQDLDKALSLEPEHISYYQLTLEPNTQFHANPPKLPDDDCIWEMEAGAHELLETAGYCQYEVSAFAKPGFECNHNRNYWEFGDYLGIGAGAHGKISDITSGMIGRSSRPKSPSNYIESVGVSVPPQGINYVQGHDLVLEFMLNSLRLKNGFVPEMFERRTGLPLAYIRTELSQAVERGLLEVSEKLIRPTAAGRRFLNELLDIFVTEL